MLNYPLTRDEHMAIFDAQTFATGKLAQPLAAEWREYFRAISPDFLREVPENALLSSGYLPGHSMMRALFGVIADPALMNPILWAIGFLALYDIARRLFADTPGAVWIALATYLFSAQVLVNAMTSYAMTAHLALNLVWLALFVRGKWWQHVLVLAIGFLALGLHQLTYHPLFAGPFILMLLVERRWPLFTVYALFYSAAGLFWLSYPSIVLSSFDIEASSGAASGIAGYLERIWAKAAAINLAQSALMEFNILRFMVWMPIFVLPLLVLAWPDVRRFDAIAFPLLLGIALMLLMRTILLPYQGHGWGYRSLHGLIGNVAILSGYGYVHWAKHQRERADGTLALLGGATAFVVLPFLLWSAHQFVAPYARLSAAIERQPTDYVIIDTETSLAAIDQVRNRADLSNRPLVLSSIHLDNARLVDLCAKGSVTWVDAEDIAAAELPMPAFKPFNAMRLNAKLLEECAQPFDPSMR
ncbi:hypothetical protein [Altererythrobacter ishigakiensis]|nr:hypothetical protein [Altererythrobacter ishigakiensis]